MVIILHYNVAITNLPPNAEIQVGSQLAQIDISSHNMIDETISGDKHIDCTPIQMQ